MIDLIAMLENLSESLISVEKLVMGAGYIFGIMFVFNGLLRLTRINPHSREGVGLPVAFIIGGAALIYMPSTVEVLTYTYFGSDNILQYTKLTSFTVYGSMRILIQTAGFFWFVRGTVLMMHAAEPGKQHGLKGLAFIITSIFAINFDYTVSSLDIIAKYLTSLTTHVI